MMSTARNAIRAAFACVGFLMLAMPAAIAADKASANDTARILAGMPVDEDSPLASFTKNASWQRHAKHFDAAWARLDKGQLTKIRAWSDKHIPERQANMFYMFSGPDFLYADAFYGSATTYVLSALEPVGPIPDLAGMSTGQLSRELAELQQSVNSVLSYSFFITKKMKTQLRGGRLSGTLPVLYLFLARSGKTIEDVSYVAIDSEGHLLPSSEDSTRHGPKGAKITFSGADGKQRTLYYFSTDLSNDGVKTSGFLQYCAGLGHGDSLIKSASYLMHSDYFSTVRDFILNHSEALVEDDSGIPLRYFKPEDWNLYPFGNYLGPISIFPGKYQRDLRALYMRDNAGPIDFGIGYRWRPRQSNLLLAIRKVSNTAQGE